MKTRAVALLLVGVSLVSEMVVVAASARPKPQLGVFGTIHGKKFKATNREGVADPCVRGIYNPKSGVMTFAALECRKHRRRQGATKRNYKTLVIGCTKADASAPTPAPPFQMPCALSVYSETKTGRFGLPKSKTEWGASFAYDGMTHSGLNIRIDAVEGAIVRGVLTGVFSEPISGEGSEVPAEIAGEVRFEFPFEVR